MGDRALVVFKNSSTEEASPTVYLHWHGRDVPLLLRELKELMRGREGDVEYACARFVGICHAHISGNMSLGIWNTPNDIRLCIHSNDPADLKNIADYSHGDAGMVVVDVADFSWVAYGGYLRHSDVE